MPQYPALLEVLYDFHTRTRTFCELYRTFIPVPGTSVRSVRPRHSTRGTGTAFLFLPGTSVSSVRPCHNTRNFCEFCNTSIPVPETSASSVRLPYPYSESTNPTEHNLGYFCFQVSFCPVKRGNRAGSCRNESDYSRRGTQINFPLLESRSCEKFGLAHFSIL